MLKFILQKFFENLTYHSRSDSVSHEQFKATVKKKKKPTRFETKAILIMVTAQLTEIEPET